MKRKPLFVLIPIALFFAVGGVVMLLWNWLIPVLFGLKTISYMQALGLFLLSRILLGSFGFGNKKPPFANPNFRNKMMNMTTEERQKFKEEWKSRCSSK
jgi:hypothetical protein